MATRRAASVCSLTTSNHAAAGCNPSRPPVPRTVWKPSISPRRAGGTPIARKSAAARRMAVRSVLLARIGPCFQILGAGK